MEVFLLGPDRTRAFGVRDWLGPGGGPGLDWALNEIRAFARWCRNLQTVNLDIVSARRPQQSLIDLKLHFFCRERPNG